LGGAVTGAAAFGYGGGTRWLINRCSDWSSCWRLRPASFFGVTGWSRDLEPESNQR